MERESSDGVVYICDRCGRTYATLRNRLDPGYVSNFRLMEGQKTLIGPPKGGELCGDCTEELITWYYRPSYYAALEKADYEMKRENFRKMVLGEERA